MAFNWGAALGAAVTTGLNTYERLGEEELRAMQRQQLKKEIAEKEALDQAWRQSQARVGQTDDYTEALKTGSGIGTQQAQMLSNQGALPGATAEDQAFERASAEAAAGAMRENAVRQGAIPAGQAAPEMKPTEYTSSQAMQDYVKAAGQVSRKGALEAIQMKSAMRTSELEDEFDKVMKQGLFKVQNMISTGNVDGFLKEAKNKGLDVRKRETKDGGLLIDYYENDKKVKTFGSLESAGAAAMPLLVQHIANTEGLRLFGSAKDAFAYMQGERKVKAAELSAQADIEYKGKGGVIDRAYQTGARGGAGGGSGTTERILAKAEELSKDKNSKFYGQKEKAYEFLKRGFNRDEDAAAWNDIEKKLRGDGESPQNIAAQRADFFSTRGYAPPVAVQALRTGVNPVTKKPLTEKELSDFNRTYPKTPWQDILGTDTPPLPPSFTQQGGIPVPR